MTKALLTGASGFIGRRLAPHLLKTGYEVVALGSSDGDVADPEAWLRQPAADVVVHLAGRTFVPASWEDPQATVRTNLLGTMGALEYCRRQGARMVFVSAYIYGSPDDLPIKEDAPLRPSNPYALSKKLAEDTCRFYAEQLGVPVTIIRPFNVYGPGQGDDFLIPSIIRQLHAGAISLKDLSPRRDYVYVDDVVEAIARAVERPAAFETYNIGSGVSQSVAEVVEMIQRIWGVSVPVRSEEVRRPGEVMDTVADISRASRGLGWTPRFSLEAGLRQMRSIGDTFAG